MRRTVSLRLGAGLAAAGLCAFLGAHGLDAQGFQQPAPRTGPFINQSDDPLLRNFVWRAIGPANIGGRLDDIAVVESNPSIIYLGFATGGVWKSTNNGTTWTSIFEKYPVSSIGDIAIAPSNPDVIYVGTGEPNNRQSASFGAGVYKSTDGGKSFEYVGLKETQSIARIVVHPKDPNIVYVAAIGHLFGPNAERGLYKSTDGGKTWNNTKFIDNDTGFTDVVMDPVNPNILYAASYQRRRVPWGFNGGGPGSGIWKTTDAGKTWTKLTGNGLPTNPIIGRIGLDIARSRPQTLYASIEVGPSGGTGAGVNDNGTLQTPEEAQRGGSAAANRSRTADSRNGATRRSSSPSRPRTSRASGVRTIPERHGGFCRTAWIGRCTTARFAWTRPTRISHTRAARRFSRRPTAASTGSRCRDSRTAITMRSGSTRTTTITCSSATTAASTSRGTRPRPGNTSTR